MEEAKAAIEDVLTKETDGKVTKTTTVQETVTREKLVTALFMSQQYQRVSGESYAQATKKVAQAQAQLDQYDVLVKAASK